jgi:hypothetical protein
MGNIRLCVPANSQAIQIPFPDVIGLLLKHLESGHLFRSVFLGPNSPVTIRTAEGRDPRFCGDAGTGQNHKSILVLCASCQDIGQFHDKILRCEALDNPFTDFRLPVNKSVVQSIRSTLPKFKFRWSDTISPPK